MSMKTGLAPSKMTQLEEAMKEKEVVMTSSPGFRPRALTVRCSPLVPEFTATPCFTPA